MNQIAEAVISLLEKRGVIREESRAVYVYGLSQMIYTFLSTLGLLLIGLAALVTGILLGILLSQGLGLLTIAMFSAYPSGEAFGLVLSGKAVGKTALYFGVIFLLVMVFTGLSVSRARLIDLMQSGRRNEEMRERPLWRDILVAVLGLATIPASLSVLLIHFHRPGPTMFPKWIYYAAYPIQLLAIGLIGYFLL